MPLNPKMLLAAAAVCALAVFALVSIRSGEEPGGRSVVVYTSVDSEFALPLFEEFTKQTGIKVIPRTDGEASKTTAMAERLMQMKDNPDGDVFWNSELSLSQVLAGRGVLQPYVSPEAQAIPAQHKDREGRWTGFGCRARVLIYNTSKVKREDVPATLEGLADPRWKNRVAIAKPLFGTTRSHLVALAVVMGEEKAFQLFRAWHENGMTLAESNSDVRNRVAEGTFDLGLTDTDDALEAMDRHKPVDFTVPDQTASWRGAFLIPNTAGLLSNCPHPAEGKLFIDFLLRPGTEARLAGTGARQIPVRSMDAKLPEALKKLTPAEYDNEKVAAQVLPLAGKILRILQGDEK